MVLNVIILFHVRKLKIRCEDLGYDWYEGSAEKMSEKKSDSCGDGNDDTGNCKYKHILDINNTFPIKHKGKGETYKR